MEEIKNYGFKLPVIDTKKDYILGKERHAPFEIINPSGQWEEHIQPFESQFKTIDTSSCTAYASIKSITALLHYLYGMNENYSERFLAIMSDQEILGNDPHKVLESIRKDGCIADALLPFTDDITSFEEYLTPKPMTAELKSVGRDWVSLFDFKHEYLFHQESDIDIAEKQQLIIDGMKRSPVNVSVRAWSKTGELYTKKPNTPDTHFTTIKGYVEGQYWIVDDSYLADGVPIKKLAWDYDFQIAKGIFIRKRTPEEQKDFLLKEQGLLLRIVNTLVSVITTLIKTTESLIPTATVVTVPEKKPSIQLLAKGIEKYENVRKELNNPGGLRSSPFQNGKIIQSSTGKELATFANYEAGFNALIHQIRIVCNGQSPAYTKEAKKLGLSNCADLTLEQFLHIYAPASENKTEYYVRFIEGYIGQERSITMKNFL